MKRKIWISIIVIATFIICKYTKYFYGYIVFGKEKWNELDFDIKISYINYTQMIIMSIVAYLIFKKSPLKTLGLQTGFKEGLLCATICVLPMVVGYGLLFGFNVDLSLKLFHRDFVLTGFFEEFAYRAFLFGLLFFYAGWGFIPAALITSLFFAAGHLYQAHDIVSAISIYIFTALASTGFAWFYLAWNSLWMVIFLHTFMDFVWDTFGVQDNVVGSLWVNVFRFSTLGLAIYFSVKKAKKENRYSLKNQVWINKHAL